MKTIKLNEKDIDLSNYPRVAEMLSTEDVGRATPVDIPYVPHPLEGGKFLFEKVQKAEDFFESLDYLIEIEND